ncbi:MAG: hypothetical protein ACQERK_03340 [Campylobacterota bacterium]
MLYLEIAIALLLVILIIIEYKRLALLKAHTAKGVAHEESAIPQSETGKAQDCDALHEHIEEEISKLKRYNTYSVTHMNFTMNLDAVDVAKKLKDFVRKSDRVFACKHKVYIFFPFTKDSHSIRQKIEKRILNHLQGEYDKEVKFITVKFQGFKYDPELNIDLFPKLP